MFGPTLCDGSVKAASNWISPAERYAVVPDETLGPLASRLHQTANVSSRLVKIKV